MDREDLKYVEDGLLIYNGEDVDEGWYSNHKRWGNQQSRAKKKEFAQTMSDIDDFCKENGISQSSTSDSYYFTIDGQNYRVSNHSVEASKYHDGREQNTVYIHASKTRIKDIYNDLKAGHKLDGRGNIVESINDSPLKSNGIYSVLQNKWIKEPVAEDIPEIDENEFDKLYNIMEDKYFDAVESEDEDKITDFIEDIYDLRKDSLKEDGEFGIGNIVFKEFRNLGYLDNLKDLRNSIKSKNLSLLNNDGEDMKEYEIDDNLIHSDLNESSVSRVWQHLTDDSTCAIISTYRGERSEAENYKLFKELKDTAKKKYGFIEFVSRWSEENDDGEVESSDERALLIPNIPYEEALKLSQKYNQSSFIFKDSESCEEICSTPFIDYDGNSHQVNDVVRTFNTSVDDNGILNTKDAEEIFAKRKGGPASHLVKGDHRSFHLKEVLEVVEPRASYFQKGKYYINIFHNLQENKKKKYVVESHGTAGVYNFYGRLYNDIKFDESKMIAFGGELKESIIKIEEPDKKGGMIVLSTDVNAVKQSDNKVIDFIKKKFETLKNRVGYKKKVDKVANKRGETYWTIGKYLDGRYKSKNGSVFDENSISIELLGIPREELISMAEELCGEFKQESVLVKDYTNGEIMYVDEK